MGRAERYSTFSPHLQEQASKFSVPNWIFKGRTEVNGVSIDGSKDPNEIDDAVWFEQDGNDIRAQVHIVDSSALLDMGSDLDQEAYSRVFSRYFAHHANQMLPPELTRKAGLAKGQKIPTITYSFTIGNSIGERGISFTYLTNRNQLTFGGVNRIIKDEDHPYNSMLRTAALAAEGIQNERVSKGGKSWLREHFPECFTQEVDWLRIAPGARIVQESMLEAGTMTAKHFTETGASPGLFRVYPSPDGIFKSSYSPIPSIHEGLKVIYSHATSPLRRYPDVAIQRQLASDLFLNIRAPYDRVDMAEMADLFSSAYRQFLMRLDADQIKFSSELNMNLQKGKIGNGFREKVMNRIEQGKVTKYDVFKVLAVNNGHSSNIAEVQRTAFVWLGNHPHFLNDFINFVKEEKTWAHPNYPEQDGILVATMKVGDQTKTSREYPVNGDQRMSRNLALLNLLKSLLNLDRPEEHTVFSRTY